jgi:hypothetical protein
MHFKKLNRRAPRFEYYDPFDLTTEKNLLVYIYSNRFNELFECINKNFTSEKKS